MALIISVVIGVLLAMAAGLVHVPPVRRYVLAQGEDYLETSQQIDLQAGRLDYNIFGLSVTLHDVTIRAAHAPQSPPFLTASRAYVNLDAIALVRGRFTVEEAVLEGVQIQLVADENGGWNLPRQPEQSRAPPAEIPQILIDSLTATGTQILVEDHRQAVAIHLPRWRLSINGQPETLEHAIRLSIERAGEASYEGRRLPLNELGLGLLWRGGQLQVREARLRLGGSAVAVGGRVNRLPEPVAALDVDANLQVGELARFAAGRDDLSGLATLRASVSESLTAPRVTGRIRGEGLAYGAYEGISLESGLAWDPGAKVVTADSLVVRSPYGNVEGRATLATETGESSVEATLGGVDLARISRELELGSQIASTASGNVTARWPALDWGAASGKATVQLATQREPAEKVLPVRGRLDLTAQSGQARVSIRSIEALRTTATGAVSFDRDQNLAGNLQVEGDDVGAVLEALSTYLGREPAQQRIEGGIRVAARLAGTLDKPSVMTEVDGGPLSVGDVRDVMLRATAAYEGDQVRISEAVVAWRDQSVRASGGVGLGGENPELRFDVAGEGVDIPVVLSAFVAEPPVEGVADFTASVSGTTEQPLAEVRLSGAGLRAYGESWGRLTANATYSDGRVEVSALRLEKPGGDGRTGIVQGSGSYVPESQEYSFQATADLEVAGLTLPSGSSVTGRLRGDAKGAGVVSNPTGEVEAGVSAVVFDGRRLGDFSVTAIVADQVAEARLRAPRLGVDGRVQASMQAPYDGEFDVKADFDDLSVLAIQGPDGEVITGALQGTAQGRGELANWKTLDASARIELARAVVNGQEVRTTKPVEARLEGGVLRVEPSVIFAGGTEVSLDGALPLEAAVSSGEEFRVDASGALESVLAFVPDLGGVGAKGMIEAHARVRGGMDSPEPTVTATLRDGEITVSDLEQPITGVELNLETKNREIVLDRLAAHWIGATFSASGALPLGLLGEAFRSGPPGVARFRASVQGLDPGTVQGAPEQLSGALALEVEGEASSLELAAVSAAARFDELRLRMGDITLDQSSPAHISLRDGLVHFESFDLSGGVTRLSVSGTARLDGSQEIDIRVAGSTDASLFTSLIDTVRATGPAEYQLAATGTIPEPKIEGSLQLHDGRIASQAPPIEGENINLSLRFTPGLLEIVEGAGTLNGGPFRAIGFAAYDPAGLGDINLLFDVDRMYMNFPAGMRTLSNARLRITERDAQIVVDGRVRIAEGSYRDPLDPAKLLASDRGVEFVEERNPLLSRIRFDVDVETEEPIVIDNELARLTLSSDLVLVGTYYRPSITGRLDIDEGGEIYLAEHDYVIETGVVNFVNENRVEPVFNVLAHTHASGHDINLTITGSTENLDTSFTSDEGLSEPDIISLLLTGRTLDEARGSGLNVAGQQAMSYLTGQLGGRFSRAAEETLGLSRVRIEPNLVSGDSNPGARLTVGQDLRRDLRLIYSMNLVDSSDQILIGEYDLTKRFGIRGTNQSDNTRRVDFRHDLRFGGKGTTASGSRNPSTAVGRVELTGERVFPDDVLLEKLGVESGRRYDFFRVRRGMDRLERYYRDREYLEARIRLEQEREANTVHVTIYIEAGPQVEFVYEGFSLPGGLRNRIRRIWARGVFDAKRTDDAATEIRRWFVGKHYLEAEIKPVVRTPEEGVKSVLFDMRPGTRYESATLAFEGAQALSPERLRSLVLDEPDGLVDSIVSPQRIVDLLTQFYRQEGYLSGTAGRPRLDLESATGIANVVFPIEEGPLFRFGQVEISGNRALSEADLRAVITVYPDESYRPESLRNSVEKLEEIYWSHGYNDVTIEYQPVRNAELRTVDIQFQIDEQKQGVVEKIEVAGNNDVGAGFIRSQLAIHEGDALDYRKTELSRRALYKTGSFSLVELETEPLAAAAGGEGSRSPLLLTARVREVTPYRIRYGGFYDTDRGPGAILDFENRNSLLGGARLLGFRSRYDSDLHEIRGYFGQPLYLKFPSVIGATTFLRRELRETFITDRVGFSLLHELELRENMVFSYGYRFERAHTFEKEPDPFLPFDETLRIAPLTTSYTWDTRDELLDASRGFFVSNALEYAPSALGSDLRYIKYLGQFFKYVPLTAPAEIPFGRGLKRARVIYAGGVRVGLGRGFGGQSIIPSERFYAGGGTTVRGFKQDWVGPIDFVGFSLDGEALFAPAGGDALFVANNELRFPLVSMFEGVGFVDLGNVYDRVADFNPFDVRSSAGAGLRVRTPYFLVRFDYGFKLDRKPGEGIGAFFFSVGQAF